MNKNDLILARDLASQALHKATMAHEGSTRALAELRHAVNMFDAILFDKPMVHDEPEDAKPIPDLPELPERAQGSALYHIEDGIHVYSYIDSIGVVINARRPLTEHDLAALYEDAHTMYGLRLTKVPSHNGHLYRDPNTANFSYTEDNT